MENNKLIDTLTAENKSLTNAVRSLKNENAKLKKENSMLRPFAEKVFNAETFTMHTLAGEEQEQDISNLRPGMPINVASIETPSYLYDGDFEVVRTAIKEKDIATLKAHNFRIKFDEVNTVVQVRNKLVYLSIYEDKETLQTIVKQVNILTAEIHNKELIETTYLAKVEEYLNEYEKHFKLYRSTNTLIDRDYR